MGIQVKTTNATNSRIVHVADTKTGTLWSSGEWRKIVNGAVRKGTLLKIINSNVDKQRINSREAPAVGKRAIAFTCVAFGQELPFAAALASSDINRSYSYSYTMVAADQRGQIFAFDFHQNKFWVVARSGVAVTCIAFSNIRKREIIVGLVDKSLHCYNIETCQLVAKLPAFHHYEPHHISSHISKAYAISSCKSEALLWDTEEWSRKRLLTGNQCGVQQASFSSDGMSIITAFSDGSIFVWYLDTFTLQWKLSLEQMTGNLNREIQTDKDKFLSIIRASYFATTLDHEILAYSGLSSTLYVWNVVEKRLLHEIVIPSFQSQWITQIEFLGTTKIAALLSNEGDLIFIDVVVAKFMGQLQGKHKFNRFTITPDGYTMSLILQDEKYTVSMLALDSILQNKVLDTEINVFEEFEEKSTETEVKAKIPTNRTSKVLKQPKTFYELIESKNDTKVLNRNKLKGFLNYYGVYPEKHRTLIWRFMLKIPENRQNYESLLQQGLHPEHRNFRKKFPMKSEKMSKTLEKIISALTHWSPIFENLDYLPALVFPFAKLFNNDLFSGLEIIITIILNWCQKWWEYFPNPPVECLDILEELLGYHDSEVLDHFKYLKVNAQIYGWLPMHTLFSELFGMEDWLRLWDHLISNPPSFMYYVIIAYVKYYRSSILKAEKYDDFRFFFQRRNAINISKLLVMAYDIQKDTPSKISADSFLTQFTPISKGQYPIFNKYPEFIVNYQSQMKEKIRNEEIEYLKKRKVTEEMSRLNDELSKDKNAWETADWKMNDMIENWWDKMTGEDQYLNDRKARLDVLEKDAKSKLMNTVKESRKSFLEHQEAASDLHINTLSKAIGKNRLNYEKTSVAEAENSHVIKLEGEWMQRKDELMQTRKNLEILEKERMNRLAQRLGQVGLENAIPDPEIAQKLAEKDVLGGRAFTETSPVAKKSANTGKEPQKVQFKENE